MVDNPTSKCGGSNGVTTRCATVVTTPPVVATSTPVLKPTPEKFETKFDPTTRKYTFLIDGKDVAQNVFNDQRYIYNKTNDYYSGNKLVETQEKPRVEPTLDPKTNLIVQPTFDPEKDTVKSYGRTWDNTTGATIGTRINGINVTGEVYNIAMKKYNDEKKKNDPEYTPYTPLYSYLENKTDQTFVQNPYGRTFDESRTAPKSTNLYTGVRVYRDVPKPDFYNNIVKPMDKTTNPFGDPTVGMNLSNIDSKTIRTIKQRERFNGNVAMTPDQIYGVTKTVSKPSATQNTTIQDRNIVRTTPTVKSTQLTGTVKYIPLEGGFWAIDGYNVRNSLPEEYRKEGLKIKYTPKVYENQSSVYMWGTMADANDVSLARKQHQNKKSKSYKTSKTPIKPISVKGFEGKMKKTKQFGSNINMSGYASMIKTRPLGKDVKPVAGFQVKKNKINSDAFKCNVKFGKTLLKQPKTKMFKF